MSDLERYLRRATRGLWGRGRAEVMAELRGSIEARAWALEALGWGRDEALSQALRELGRPEAISAGLVRVHTMPKLLTGTALAAVFSAVLIATLPSGAAQVAATTRVPSITCQESPSARLCLRFRPPGTAWLRLSSLKAALRGRGVGVRDADPGLELALPEGAIVAVDTGVPFERWARGGFRLQGVRLRSDGKVATIEGRRPGSETLLRLQVREDASRKMVLDPVPVTFERDGEPYVPATALVDALASGSGLPVTLRGWTNPRLTFGRTSFTLGSAEDVVNGREFYAAALGRALSSAFSDVSISPEPPPRLHRLSLKGTPGAVYGIVTRDLAGRFALDVAVLTRQGELELRAPWPRLEFASDLGGWQPPRLGSRPKAVLVRLTGRLDDAGPVYEVVRPSFPTSDTVQ